MLSFPFNPTTNVFFIVIWNFDCKREICSMFNLSSNDANVFSVFFFWGGGTAKKAVFSAMDVNLVYWFTIAVRWLFVLIHFRAKKCTWSVTITKRVPTMTLFDIGRTTNLRNKGVFFQHNMFDLRYIVVDWAKELKIK